MCDCSNYIYVQMAHCVSIQLMGLGCQTDYLACIWSMCKLCSLHALGMLQYSINFSVASNNSEGKDALVQHFVWVNVADQ